MTSFKIVKYLVTWVQTSSIPSISAWHIISVICISIIIQIELKEIKKLYCNNNGITFMATSIRTRRYRCLIFLKKSRTVDFFLKPLSDSDSCYDLFYSLILSFLMEGHLPFMAPAV